MLVRGAHRACPAEPPKGGKDVTPRIAHSQRKDRSGMDRLLDEPDLHDERSSLCHASAWVSREGLSSIGPASTELSRGTGYPERGDLGRERCLRAVGTIGYHRVALSCVRTVGAVYTHKF